MGSDLQHGFRVGSWTVEPLTGQITGPDDESRHLQPKVMQVLVCLAAHANEPVTRDELLTAVWGERAVSDEPLTHAISELRRALQDDRGDPRYIETIPKRGYRLIGHVEVPERGTSARIGWAAYVVIALLAVALVSVAYNTWWDSAPPDKSIAVLPFQNLSGDPDQDYFSDGISETLIHVLAQVSGLKVTAKTSSFYFKDKDVDVREIGRALNVGAVLEGSLLIDGDDVRVIAQLVNANDRTHLWSKSFDFDRNSDDVFEIQEEIAREVVKAFHVELRDSEEARLTRHYRPTLAAYEQLILGRYEMARRTADSLAAAERHFRKAIELDPGYALAYVGLARTYDHQQSYGGLLLEESFRRQQPLVDKALELDPLSGDAHTAKAALDSAQQLLTRKGSRGREEFEAKEQEYLKAIELNPNNATAHQMYGILLSVRGRPEDALLQIRQAVELDPMSPVLRSHVADFTWDAGRVEEALTQVRLNIERNPEFANNYSLMSRFQSRLGHLAEAQLWIREARARNPEGYIIRSRECSGLVDLGDPIAAEDCVRQFVEADPANLYSLYSQLPLQAYRREWGAAIATLESCRERLPGWGPYTRMLATLVAGQGDIERARRLMADAYPDLLRDDIDLDASIQSLLSALTFSAILHATGETQRRDMLLLAMEERITSMHRIRGIGYGILDVYIHVMRGDRDQAIAGLRDAIDMGWRTYHPVLDTSWWTLRHDWRLKSLHEDPEFIALVNELEADVRRQREWYQAHKDEGLF